MVGKYPFNPVRRGSKLRTSKRKKGHPREPKQRQGRMLAGGRRGAGLRRAPGRAAPQLRARRTPAGSPAPAPGHGPAEPAHRAARPRSQKGLSRALEMFHLSSPKPDTRSPEELP